MSAVKMDPKVVLKTQEALGKHIKKPPLTDKLLSKPPFRYLHDLHIAIIRSTGFMKGLYDDNEMKSDYYNDSEKKKLFLQKGIDVVALITGKKLAVKTAKILSGQEPDKTNEYLQQIGAAIKKQPNSDDAVRQILSKLGQGDPTKLAPPNDSKHKPSPSPERKPRREKPSIKSPAASPAAKRAPKPEAPPSEPIANSVPEQASPRKPAKGKKGDTKTEQKSKTSGQATKSRIGQAADDRTGGASTARKEKVQNAKRRKSLVASTPRAEIDSRNSSLSPSRGMQQTSTSSRPISSKRHQPPPLNSETSANPSARKRSSVGGRVQQTSGSASSGSGLSGTTNNLLASHSASNDALDSNDVKPSSSLNSEFTESLGPRRPRGNRRARSRRGLTKDSPPIRADEKQERPSSARGPRRRLQEGRRRPPPSQGDPPLGQPPENGSAAAAPMDETDAASEEVRNHAAQRQRSSRPDKRSAPRSAASDQQSEDLAPSQVQQARRAHDLNSANARAAPPKHNAMVDENMNRIDSGKRVTVIRDGGESESDDNQDDDDDDVLGNSITDNVVNSSLSVERDDGDDEDDGGLVRKMLQTKKGLQQRHNIQQNDTRSTANDAQRMKERQLVAKEVEQLKKSIQSLSKSSNHLGTIMDFLQEDMDAMQKELEQWRRENNDLGQQIKIEQSTTDQVMGPLQAQRAETEARITDQADANAALKAQIMNNEQKIKNMIISVGSSSR